MSLCSHQKQCTMSVSTNRASMLLNRAPYHPNGGSLFWRRTSVFIKESLCLNQIRPMCMFEVTTCILYVVSSQPWGCCLLRSQFCCEHVWECMLTGQPLCAKCMLQCTETFSCKVSSLPWECNRGVWEWPTLADKGGSILGWHNLWRAIYSMFKNYAYFFLWLFN